MKKNFIYGIIGIVVFIAILGIASKSDYNDQIAAHYAAVNDKIEMIGLSEEQIDQDTYDYFRGQLDQCETDEDVTYLEKEVDDYRNYRNRK